jgi:hypothetical protein
MLPALETISNTLLPALEGTTAREKWVDCAGKYPWYPLPWLMLANVSQPETVAKASLWFTNEYRLQWLLNQKPAENDIWLTEQLSSIRKTGYLPEKEAANPETEPLPAPVKTLPAEVKITEDHTTKTALADEALANDTEAPAQTAETETNAPALKISFGNNQPLKENAPLFEPYHAVDYFASQGIRLNQAGIPKDKLEQQLKSFTQWLKTMKKVAPTTAPAYADPVVEAQAVQSNTEKEVLTEAMALVLEKQGKFGKAVAIYEKLLLLHPEKGALFAARIEDLKSIKQ